MVRRNIGSDLVNFVHEENTLVNESIFPNHVVQEYVQTPGRKHDNSSEDSKVNVNCAAAK